MVTDKHSSCVLSLIGLSSDTKPTKATLPYMKNGSQFKEVDTGKIYIFDETLGTTGTWHGPWDPTCIDTSTRL